MIRVLIAEDEPPTLRRLRRLIETTDPSFTVVGTAEDGEQVMQRLAETPCDIVFTDIRMPVMDGLRVMDEIREKYPHVIVVAVSGYQDFAYVTHGIRAQIMDYILKPVSREAMEGLLLRLREAVETRDRARMARQLAASIRRPAVDAGLPPVDMPAESLMVFLFCAGPMPADDDAQLYPGAVVFEQLSLEAIVAEAAGARGFAWAFMGTSPVERILIVDAAAMRRESVSRLYALVQAASEEVPVSCAYSPEPIALAETGGVIRRLRRQLRARIVIGRGLCVPLEEAPVTVKTPWTQADARALASLIRGGRLSPTSEPFARLLSRMRGEEWTQQAMQSLFDAALAALGEDASLAKQIASHAAVIGEILCTSVSVEGLIEGLEALGPLEGAERVPGRQESIAGQVAAHLREHHAEHINTQLLAQRFGYVPSYISVLFRRVYGVSPSEYLMQVRLQEAKRLLTERPDMLVREVAEAVGFKNQHHFSRIFKKHEGVWPSGYAPGEGEA